MESGRVEEERLTLWRRNGSRRGGGTAHPVEEERLTPWRRTGSPRRGCREAGATGVFSSPDLCSCVYPLGGKDNVCGWFVLCCVVLCCVGLSPVDVLFCGACE